MFPAICRLWSFTSFRSTARVEPTPRSRTPASLPRLTCPGATSTGSFRLTSASAPPQRWSARAAPRETSLVRNDDRLDRSAVWVCHPYRFSLRFVPWPNYSLRGLSLRGTRPSDSAERRRWMRPALDSCPRPRLTPYRSLHSSASLRPTGSNPNEGCALTRVQVQI